MDSLAGVMPFLCFFYYAFCRFLEISRQHSVFWGVCFWLSSGGSTLLFFACAGQDDSRAGEEYFVCMTCMWCQQGVFSCNLHASPPACCVLRHEKTQQNSEWVRNCQSENYANPFCVFACMTYPQDRVKRKLYVLTQNNFMPLLLDVKQKKNKKRTFRGKNRW